MQNISLCCIVFLFFYSVRGTGVHVSVSSSWEETSIVYELAEAISQIPGEFFWQFTSQFHTTETSVEDDYKEAWDLTKRLVKEERHRSILQYSVASRFYSPAVTTHRQMAEYDFHRFPESERATCDIHNPFAIISWNSNKEMYFDEEKNLQLVPVEENEKETTGEEIESKPEPEVKNYEVILCDSEKINNTLYFLGSQDTKTIFPSYWENPLPNEHMTGHMFSNMRVVLYSDFGSKESDDFAFLFELSKNFTMKMSLIQRFGIPKKVSSEKLSVQGYGVELALKNTEYRVVDDTSSDEKQTEQKMELDKEEIIEGINFHTLVDKKPEHEEKLRELRKDLLQGDDVLRPLKRWEMKDLSVQAAYVASKVDDPWEFLRDLTGNFPSLATSLSKVKVSEEFLSQVEDTRGKYSSSEFALINGKGLDLNHLNPFDFLQTLEEEISLYDQLELMDIPISIIKDIMMTPVSAESTYRLNIPSEEILWLNNLESDPAYLVWPNSLHELFKPSWPDQLKFIRQNLIHLTLFIDPLSEDAFSIYPLLEMFLQGKAPIRMGIVFDRIGEPNEFLGKEREWNQVEDCSEPIGDVFISSFVYLYRNVSPATAVSFLKHMSLHNPNQISYEIIQRFLKKYKTSLVDLYSDPHRNTLDEFLLHSSDFQQSVGLASQSPSFFFNGEPQSFPFSNEGISNALRKFAPSEYQLLAQMLWEEDLKQGDDIYKVVLEYKEAQYLYDSVILSTKAEYHSLTSVTMPVGQERQSYRLSSTMQLGLGEFLLQQLDYIKGPSNSKNYHDITHLLVLDFATEQGMRTLINLASRFEDEKDSEGIRFSVIHNSGCLFHPSKNFEDRDCFILYNDLVNIVSRTLTPNKYIRFLNQVFPLFLKDSEKEQVDIISELRDTCRVGTVKMEMFMDLWKNVSWRRRVLEIHHHVLRQVFTDRIQPGKNYVITNGRVTEIPENLSELSPAAFRLLESLERSKTKLLRPWIDELDLQHIIEQESEEALERLDENDFRSEIFMKVSALLLSSAQNQNRKIHPVTEYSSHAVDIKLVLNPLSKVTRRAAPIILDLQKTFPDRLINIELTLNPAQELSELPLQSYYRYNVKTDLISFYSKDQILPSAVTFTDLPLQPTFSLHIDAPSSWMVESFQSVYDLDNLILSSVEEKFALAEYRIRHLVIQGSAVDTNYPGNSARGTELLLLDINDKPVKDTLVMANYGYFQLQANPGLWKIQLDAGRSSKVYQLPSDETQSVFVTSFTPSYILTSLSKREGMESTSVLDIPTKKNQDQMIHVFSLASGHLYERFLKIMILSVLRSTESPVTFWFVENFLSASFKSDVQVMSQELGFQVELVRYQWPSWLHAQTEKQRIIWAYKILFLDVLFPLDVHRVIFVDADLVIRGDLRELHELDLEGAPYGYTPFCDSREEMEGFRFWKTGFWKDHLASLSATYHISALYVIDLDEFRNNAIGDILRSVYSNLSKDPNSLANLDQDLPNFTQNNIPIYSLDSSWLWCETWCSDESKASAKAIDLCNNPLTKTPKLENAVRIIEEWEELDQIARGYSSAKVMEENKMQSFIAESTTERWHHLSDLMEQIDTLSMHQEEVEQEPSSTSWFSSIMQDII